MTIKKRNLLQIVKKNTPSIALRKVDSPARIISVLPSAVEGAICIGRIITLVIALGGGGKFCPRAVATSAGGFICAGGGCGGRAFICGSG
jgi:hypothetical protein